MIKKVIDVSEHQGIIDWNMVKGNVDGVIIRCGYGDDAVIQDDKQWKRNADECTRLGIPFGTYLYSYATSMAQAQSEAQHVLRCVKGYKLSYPIYLDLEENGTQAGAIGRAELFGDIIEKAGYWCGMYANLHWWLNYLGGLDRFTKWIAQYNSTLDFVGTNKDMWQYSSTGRINGISGNVDLNECYRDFPYEINGGSQDDNKPVQVPGKAVNDVGLWYRVHVEKLGWLAPVHDGQVAGTTGYGLRMEAMKIDTRKIPQVKIYAEAHIQGIGTIDYGYINHDTVIGTVGERKRLEAVMLRVEGLPDGINLCIQMHFHKDGWSRIVEQGDAGTFGLGKETQAIKLWIA